jgi:hypothetical protein
VVRLNKRIFNQIVEPFFFIASLCVSVVMLWLPVIGAAVLIHGLIQAGISNVNTATITIGVALLAISLRRKKIIYL